MAFKFASLFVIIFWFAQLNANPLTWSRVTTYGTKPTATQLASLGYFGQRRQLILYGGLDGDGEILDETHICNFTGTSGNLSCTWYQVNTAGKNPGFRYSHYSGVCESAQVFVIAAGQNADVVNLNDIWYFNFQTNEWNNVTTSGPTPRPRYAGGSGIADGECEFFMTMGFGDEMRTSDAFTIDVSDITMASTGEWIQVGPSFNSYDPSGPHSRCLNSGSYLNNRTFAIFGGCLNSLGIYNGGPCPSWDSWYFDIPTGNWYQLPNCVSPRYLPAMSYLPNDTNSAVMFGGDRNSEVIPTVWYEAAPDSELAILDLTTTQKWFRKIALGDPNFGIPVWRHSHNMVTGEGVVFMYGGYGIENGTSLQEIWTLIGNYRENEDLGCPQHFFTTGMAHGILMFLAWGICFQLGAVIARYAKFTDPLWFYLHISLQLLGLFFAVFGFILGFLNQSTPKFPHAIIGIVAMGLALWQPINALYRPEHKKGEKTSIFRWIWYFIHMLTGRLALLLGLINITLGLFLIIAPLPVRIIWYILFFGYILFLIVMETIYWVRCYRNYRSKKDEKQEKNE